jgi:hypothetical protein
VSATVPTISFEDLPTADLVVDAVYEGGVAGTAADDVLAKLLPGAGNQGGFREVRAGRGKTAFVALYTSGASVDWPDTLEPETGRFTYFGDNRTPGRQLHDTQRRGNQLLRRAFDDLHGSPPDRSSVPPFFVFERVGTGRARRFLGLAVPGAPDLTANDDLVAIWRTTQGLRFQNYRAVFTILDVPRVERDWLDALRAGGPARDVAPRAFRDWVDLGRYDALRAPATTNWRRRQEQVPVARGEVAIINAIYNFFEDDAYAFEACAIELWRLQAGAPVTELIGTRRSVDGGRDAIGLYSIGPSSDPVHIDFALEAKRYRLTNGVGVKEVARLISRLRHRQFGVLVTTSFVDPQAYREIREDGHPVVIMAAADIVRVLASHGMTDVVAVSEWLRRTFPRDDPAGAPRSS